MDIDFFHTPHDAAESVGYTLKFGEHKVACCTDLGYVTDEVRDNLLGSDTVYIEANYDPVLLREIRNIRHISKRGFRGITDIFQTAVRLSFVGSLSQKVQAV